MPEHLKDGYMKMFYNDNPDNTAFEYLKNVMHFFKSTNRKFLNHYPRSHLFS